MPDDSSQNLQPGQEPPPSGPQPAGQPGSGEGQAEQRPQHPAGEPADIGPPQSQSSESFLDFLGDEPAPPQQSSGEAESLHEPEEEILIENEQRETAPQEEEPEQEVLEPEHAKPTPLQSENEEEGFGDKIVALLEELNITRGQVLSVLGCIVALVVVIIGGIWGYRFYIGYRSDQPPPSVEEPDPQPSQQQTDTGVPSGLQFGIISQQQLRALGRTGIEATGAIGTSEQQASQIANAIILFRQLENAYDVDIDQLLEGTTDRRSRLRAHVALLKKLYADGLVQVDRINAELASIQIDYDEGQEQENTLDTTFFEQVNGLNGETAQTILEDFIIVNQQQVARRARFQALSRVKVFFTDGLPLVSNKIQAIELNEESIVQGIKFIEVPGIDIGLYRVLGTENGTGETPTSSSLSTAPRTITSSGITTDLPIHPTEIKTGTDYITQPGGGFER